MSDALDTSGTELVRKPSSTVKVRGGFKHSLIPNDELKFSLDKNTKSSGKPQTMSEDEYDIENLIKM